MTAIKWELAENYFLPEEHDMQKKDDQYQKGTVFLRKAALRKRLNEMDPRWSQTPPEIIASTGDVILVRGGLTVGGITRYDVGTAIIQTTKYNRDTKKSEPLPDYELARNLAKAYKTAVSDVLPRCAVQFNIGTYLKDPAAKEIRNPAELKAWLEKLSTPPHWALNGQGMTFRDIMNRMGLKWEAVEAQLEPGKTLVKLSDTVLDFPAAVLRLMDIATVQAKAASNPTHPASGAVPFGSLSNPPTAAAPAQQATPANPLEPGGGKSPFKNATLPPVK